MCFFPRAPDLILSISDMEREKCIHLSKAKNVLRIDFLSSLNSYNRMDETHANQHKNFNCLISLKWFMFW